MPQGLDLSKLSDMDLGALSKGDVSALSDDGLKLISDYQADQARPSNTHGYLERVQQAYSPGGQPAIVAEQDPEGNKRNAAIGASLAIGNVAGAGVGALGLEGLAGVGARSVGGGAAGAGSQYVSNKIEGKPGSEGVLKAAEYGAGGSLVADLIGGVAGYAGKKLSRMSKAQADAFVSDPEGVSEIAKGLEDPAQGPALQDKAVAAINESRKASKATGMTAASKLSSVLDGKSVAINPGKYLGLDPESDAIIQKALDGSKETASAAESFKNTAGPALPDSLDLPAKDANKVKQILQDRANFGQGTITDPVQKAQFSDMAKKSSALRASIESLDPSIGPLNQSMQQNMLLQEALRKGAKSSPIAFVSSEAPDRIATLARAEEAGQGGLIDMGRKIGAAKTIIANDSGSGIPAFIPKAIGRGTLLANPVVGGVAQASDPLLSLVASDPGMRSYLSDRAKEINNPKDSSIARRMLSGK